MKPDFKEYIQENVVLGDGAIGSYLYEKGVEISRNLDLLNIEDPDIVSAAHEEYIRAGSQLIETNTFGANSFKLQDTGAARKVRLINRAGAEIAGKVAGHQVYVAGSVGPTGVSFPLNDDEITEADIKEAFREQLEGLGEGGIDILLLETFSNLEEIVLAIETAREIGYTIPVIGQMVYPDGGLTVRGDSALTCGRTILKAGADMVGTNCGRGIDSMITAIKQMAPLAEEGVALSAFPNAGVPEVVGHRMLYPAQPHYMANRAGEMLKLGVRLIGGCCGTAPAHIKEFRAKLKIKPVRIKVSTAYQEAEPLESIEETETKGGFISALSPDRMPVIVELDPPRHLDIDHILKGARELAGSGVDAISLGDNPLAILRTGNVALASLIKKETGVQTIVHQTGRDTNALGLQSRMMEAHTLGIEAVLAVTGDSAGSTDQPDVSGVFDYKSYGLIRMLSYLNQGRNMAGQSIKRKTNFSIGAAFSFRPKNPDLQIRRLQKKRELGARYVLTQPMFSRELVEQMMERLQDMDMLIFPGIFPLISSRNAEFLHNEVPGISVPEELRKKLSAYEQVEDQRKIALEYTREMVENVSSTVDGFYFISPLNKWDIVLDFVKQVRKAGWRGSSRMARLVQENKV
ncbi:MAG: bifunctional homocysteine S-methyltransferase/methylenetetrahydrofolate reductase [Desulfobia sp.]